MQVLGETVNYRSIIISTNIKQLISNNIEPLIESHKFNLISVCNGDVTQNEEISGHGCMFADDSWPIRIQFSNVGRTK